MALTEWCSTKQCLNAVKEIMQLCMNSDWVINIIVLCIHGTTNIVIFKKCTQNNKYTIIIINVEFLLFLFCSH